MIQLNILVTVPAIFSTQFWQLVDLYICCGRIFTRVLP